MPRGKFSRGIVFVADTHPRPSLKGKEKSLPSIKGGAGVGVR